ncbi:MAG: class I SAM-dependent methyltransferase [Candidatus Omnitrophica bacterium]|nr:class I SAM-dependent methyltransferase [Candidatus Omnitrophota bacterium]
MSRSASRRVEIDIDRIFEDLPQIGHSNFPDLFKDRVRFFVEAIEEFRISTGMERHEIQVLDVACGVGKNSLAFAHCGYHVLAIDNGKESIDYLNRENKFTNLETELFDLYKSDFDTLTRRYNVIVVAAILEHLEDPSGILARLIDRADEPCLILGDLPNGYGAAEWVHWLRKKIRRSWGESGSYQKLSDSLRYKHNYDETDSVTLTDTPHVHDFSWLMLRDLMKENGMESIRIRNVDFLIGTPVIQKLLLSTRVAQRIDVAFAQWLPRWMANGWFFSGVCRRGS